MGCVYLVSVNYKDYVGITVNTAEERFATHVYGSTKPEHRSHLCRSLAKYGVRAAVVTTLCESDDWSELQALERHFIRKLGTRSPGGYNLTDGGDGFRGRHTEESRKKMSRSRTGQIMSPEWRANLSAAKLGHGFSEEARRKISETLRKTMTQAHKDAVSRANIGNKNSKGHKVSEDARIKMSAGAALQGAITTGREFCYINRDD